MIRSRFFDLVLSIVVVVAILNPTDPALAYLDPGTGSMLLQMILAGTAGLMVVGKLYWRKLKSHFNSSRRAATDEGLDDQ